MMDSAQYVSGATSREYAGFWLRAIASVIDGMILGIVCVPIVFIGLNIVGLAANGGSKDAAAGLAVILYCCFIVFTWVLQFGYFGLFESIKQATPGKMALGLQVTDVNGNRLSLLHALGRNLGKIVSGMTLGIGYMMAGFTERKQCLHDMMAGTLVVRRPR